MRPALPPALSAQAKDQSAPTTKEEFAAALAERDAKHKLDKEAALEAQRDALTKRADKCAKLFFVFLSILASYAALWEYSTHAPTGHMLYCQLPYMVFAVFSVCAHAQRSSPHARTAKSRHRPPHLQALRAPDVGLPDGRRRLRVLVPQAQAHARCAH